MTCEEVRSHFEEYLSGSEFLTERAGVAEHVSVCTECGDFLEEYRALARRLARFRETAGPIPKSLDCAVLSKYRQFATKGAEIVSIERMRPPLWVGSVAAAAVLAVASIWFFSSKQPVLTTAPTPTLPVTSAAKITTPTLSPATGQDVVSNVSTKEKKRHRVSKTFQVNPRSMPVQTAARVARLLPEGFRSLLYCDALSCPEDMEMIRVQLPSSALPRPMSGFIRTSGSVTADVLVGPDGFARGIRLEEIEF